MTQFHKDRANQNQASKDKMRKKRVTRRARRSALGSGHTDWAVRRKLAYFDVLGATELGRVFDAIDSVLNNVGFQFPANSKLLESWRDAGAHIEGHRVCFPKGLCQKILASAPSHFTHHARNSDRSLTIGDGYNCWAPAQGATYIRSMDGKRQPASMQEFIAFTKLSQSSPILSMLGAGFCEPMEIAPNLRHLDMLRAMITYSDKPFLAPAYHADAMADIIHMCRILFGDDFANYSSGYSSGQNCVVGGVLNLSSPLSIDDNSLDCLKILAETGQAVIISPMILLGSTSPITPVDALVQMLASNLVVAATAQLINPGAPVVLGGFISSIYMQNGAPNFASSDAEMITLAAAQCARHLKLPFRVSGGSTMSKVPDVQAISETNAGLHVTLNSGANISLNSAGSLEGGLVGCYEKFMLDVHQLNAIQTAVNGLKVREDLDTADVLKQTDNYGYFLGSRHTLDNYDNGSYRNPLFNDWTYEQWKAADAKGVNVQAKHMATRLLEDYEKPELDPDLDVKLADYIAKRKAKIKPGDLAHSSRVGEVDVQSFLANQLHDGIWDGLFEKPSQ